MMNSNGANETYFDWRAVYYPVFSDFKLPNPLERQKSRIKPHDPVLHHRSVRKILEALSMGIITYRWKATRSPSSEILSWLLTSGELVLSWLCSTESSAINEYSTKPIAKSAAVICFINTPVFSQRQFWRSKRQQRCWSIESTESQTLESRRTKEVFASC